MKIVLHFTGWFAYQTNSSCRNFIKPVFQKDQVLFKKKFLKVVILYFKPPSRTASVINRVPEVKISERDSGRHKLVSEVLGSFSFARFMGRHAFWTSFTVIFFRNVSYCFKDCLIAY